MFTSLLVVVVVPGAGTQGLTLTKPTFWPPDGTLSHPPFFADQEQATPLPQIMHSVNTCSLNLHYISPTYADSLSSDKPASIPETSWKLRLNPQGGRWVRANIIGQVYALGANEGARGSCGFPSLGADVTAGTEALDLSVALGCLPAFRSSVYFLFCSGFGTSPHLLGTIFVLFYFILFL